ncbi:ThiF family adenylyltransferase [Roseibium album]|uniref:ThiF family adenylyltransferase n=1 Tax=Roseibium album TaxID=311410 RepID=UPI0006C08D58|nr:ThiF family adenylyltransferase [Roseibium album]CTQ63517.1 thiamine/molybdopterin biosynthesis ThiF/MoeB-like protein [Roseibium album]CTQ81084.1 thiamine/molybdopterin biosynthesis ThiF/MoeB-like protein [Roseibium album]
MVTLDLILLDPHEAQIRSLLTQGAESERSAYMLFGIANIETDPWTKMSRLRLVSHKFDKIGGDALDSASGRHVTWQTDGFIRLLNDAKTAGLVPALVHTHPKGKAKFSEQDDRNEAELARTALLKGMPGLISILIAGNGSISARIWTQTDKFVDIGRILHSGPRLRISGLKGSPEAFLDRQVRLFGKEASRQVSGFRCGIAGGGATGSALLPLLLRLGVDEAVQFDKDVVDETNLNRLHGARRSDVDAKMPKTSIHTRTVLESGLGMTLVSVNAWAGHPATWDALKACDVVFCCTDDHAGRLLLNRFARFYGIPVIDVGLAMQRRTDTAYDLFARVSTLVPGHPCLLCGDYVDPRHAREEALRRNDSDAYQRLKEEAYVLGEGDPSPAVVTFTTEAATMAVNEWLAGVTGLAGADGMLPTRMRRFHARDERRPLVESRIGCPCCYQAETLGRADVQPFLEMVS